MENVGGGLCEKSFGRRDWENIHEKTGRCRDPVLRETAREVRKKKKAGYQENILRDMLEDMDRIKDR